MDPVTGTCCGALCDHRHGRPRQFRSSTAEGGAATRRASLASTKNLTQEAFAPVAWESTAGDSQRDDGVCPPRAGVDRSAGEASPLCTTRVGAMDDDARFSTSCRLRLAPPRKDTSHVARASVAEVCHQPGERRHASTCPGMRSNEFTHLLHSGSGWPQRALRQGRARRPGGSAGFSSGGSVTEVNGPSSGSAEDRMELVAQGSRTCALLLLPVFLGRLVRLADRHPMGRSARGV